MSGRVSFLLAVLACAGFGCAALWLGMDANWDLRNYHFYNGWRLLNGLVGRDVLVAQPPSFYNPLLDVPYAWAVERVPAKVIGFALGAAHGLNAVLLFAIAQRLLRPANPWAAAVLALAGATGAGGLSELGTVFYDNILSVGVLASVLVVVARWEVLAEAPLGRAARSALVAGVPVGLAFGLKQPVVLFCAGLAAAFLLVPGRGPWLALWCGLGAGLGFALTGGYWAWHLWQSTGNPLFPYFNQFFASPWGLAQSYRDRAYLPASLWDAVTLGFRYPFNPRVAGEAWNVDFRLFALLALLPLAFRRAADPLARPAPIAWLLAAALVSYALWLALFSIYRYVIALEMLAPILAVALLGKLPAGRRLRVAVAGTMVAVLMATTDPGTWLRVPWRERAIEANVPPVEPSALVLVTGHEPLSFLVPLFPKSVRFLRVDSTFALPTGPNPFRTLFRQAVEGARGPIYALHIASEAAGVDGKLAEWDRQVAEGGCHTFTSPIGVAGDPYRICLTKRLSVTDEVAEAVPEAKPSGAGSGGS